MKIFPNKKKQRMYTGHVVGEGRGLLLLLLLLLLLSLLTNFDWDPMIDRITEERSEFFFSCGRPQNDNFSVAVSFIFPVFVVIFFHLFFFCWNRKKRRRNGKKFNEDVPVCPRSCGTNHHREKKKRIKKKTQHYHRYNIFSADCSFVFCCFSVVCFFFFSFVPSGVVVVVVVVVERVTFFCVS